MPHSLVLTSGLLAAATALAAAQPGPAPEAAPVPLSLEEALRAAEATSPALVIAREGVERSRTQIDAARSAYLPTVTGSAGYARTLRTQFENIDFGPAPAEGDSTSDLPFGQRNTWQLGLQLNQSIYDGGRRSSSLAGARAGVRASQQGVKAARAQLVLEVAQAYYDALLAQRQVEIGQVTLEQAERTLADTDLSFKQGAAPEFDLVRAEVARDNQRTAMIRYRTQRDVALVNLKRAIGVPLARPLALTSPLETGDLEAVTGAARTAAGIDGPGRVALDQVREQVAIRESSLGVARADRLPQIAAVSDFGLIEYENTPFNTDWLTNWTVGVNLSVPLFDGFRRKAAVSSARADVAVARAQLDDATRRAEVEAVQADADVAAASATLETTGRTVAQAQRAYQIAELRFKQGASTHLELVDARVQLETSLLSHARSARDLRVARLRHALLAGLPLGAGAGSIAGSTSPGY